MFQLVSRFRAVFIYAAVFSLFINLLLLVPTLYVLQVFDRVLTSRSDETLVLLTLATVGALGAMMVLDLLRSRLLLGTAVAMNNRLGPKVLAQMLGAAWLPAATDPVHGLRDLSTLRNFLTSTGILTLFDAPWLPIYLAVIFLFHPLLGAVATTGAAVLLLLAYLNERMTRTPLETLQVEGRKAARFGDASLRNAEVVGGLGMIDNVARNWQSLNSVVVALQVESSRAAGVITALTKSTRQFVQIAMLATGAYLVIDTHVTAGVMMAATILLGRALAPVETAIAGWKSLVEARSSFERLDKLLAGETGRPSPMELPPLAGAVLVEKVAFSIRGHDKVILRGISFELAPGESLGLIGPSGSGKSTLARIVIGIWKPVAGVVRVDGADVTQWPRDRIGPDIGYLPQDLQLFAGSVAANIARWGNVDSVAVVEAAREANAHEMILRLPHGYDTEVGENGGVLSGGQRQRIALARALYGKPRLVVLDEPNAHLDGEGEDALMQTMLRLKRAGTTLLIVTHRPSLLANIDRVLVLREGAMEMLGPRAEIIARVARSSLPADAVVAGSLVPRTDQRVTRT